jgi:TatD DNase family protein
LDLFDTHAHLDNEQFDDDRAGVISRAIAAGVKRMCVIGCTPESSLIGCELASKYPENLRAAVGIQPNYVSAAFPDWMDEITELAQRPEVVAIGETGLDCYWQDTPLDEQKVYFDQHVRLALDTNKPLIIHMRESGEEIVAALRPFASQGSIKGVMHSFTGDIALAETCLDMGLYISFAGMVTYRKSVELRHVATRIPADRLLIETDSPYLSPEPCRAQRPNEPARLVYTAKCLAECRGIEVSELAALTWDNANRLFGW